jgi:enoyl-CoA hydratase/carnithine racemase
VGERRRAPVAAADQDARIGIVSIKSKMHAIGDEVMDGLLEAIARAERDLDGLVIWHAGALRGRRQPAAGGRGLPAGQFELLERWWPSSSAPRWRSSTPQVPVVAAVQGMALGGGCEFVMHAAHRVLALESYVGLVEAGVGLIPAGGGCKEFALQARAGAARGGRRRVPLHPERLPDHRHGDRGEERAEAVELGFAKAGDDIVFNANELLHVALHRARALAEPAGSRAGEAAVTVAGRNGIATCEMMLVNMPRAASSRRTTTASPRPRPPRCAAARSTPTAPGERAVDPRRGARAVRRAAEDREDPAAHRAHAGNRQAAAQLRENETMSKQIQDAYIVAAVRTPVAKRNGHVPPRAPRRHAGPRAARVVAKVPGLDATEIGDVIVGCAMPEAEQGMNVARIGLLLAGLPNSVPGITINRFCASGLQAVADAASRIRLGEADVMIAAGTESMSAMPQIMGNKVSLNPEIFARDENLAIAYGMGLTAEKVAQQWKVSREDQDAFAVESHRRACAAIAAGPFRDEICPTR